MVPDLPETLRTRLQDRQEAPRPAFQNGSISASVGVGGVNNPEDIKEVKKLLNGIPADRGGAFDSLDANEELSICEMVTENNHGLVPKLKPSARQNSGLTGGSHA